jgi:hypothetical protein
VAPRWDGAHLVTAWNMARNHFLFAPWYRQSAEAIVQRPVDTEAVHSLFMDLLRAGQSWAWLALAASRSTVEGEGIDIGAEADLFQALAQ